MSALESAGASIFKTLFAILLAGAAWLPGHVVDEYRLGAEDLLAIDALGAAGNAIAAQIGRVALSIGTGAAIWVAAR